MSKDTELAKHFETENKLERFGLTKADLIEVAMKAITAKNESVSIDPINAKGQLSYIFGTRAIRAALLSKGDWLVDRQDGIESVLNQKLKVRVIFQNVDKACSVFEPKAISGKGKGSKRMVENATMPLFPELEKEFESQSNFEVWYFCVSDNDDEIQAELSRPRSIEAGQFGRFLERIFVVGGNAFDVSNKLVSDHEETDDEFDFNITKKQ